MWPIRNISHCRTLYLSLEERGKNLSEKTGRKIKIVPDSKTEIGALSGPLGFMITGTLLFVLLFRNPGSNCLVGRDGHEGYMVGQLYLFLEGGDLHSLLGVWH